MGAESKIATVLQQSSVEELPENPEELRVYQSLVDQKAKEKSTEILPNAGNFHAAIVMSKLFDETNQQVNMVVGSLDGAISDKDNYMSSLEKCIDRDIPFKVIFLDPPNSDSKAYKMFLNKKAAGKNIDLYNGSAEYRQSLTKESIEKHFSVFDSNKYRFEKDTKKYLAWFSFNDTDTSEKLLQVFQRGLKTATPI